MLIVPIERVSREELARRFYSAGGKDPCDKTLDELILDKDVWPDPFAYPRPAAQQREGDEDTPVETTPPEPEEEEAEDDSAAEVEAGSP